VTARITDIRPPLTEPGTLHTVEITWAGERISPWDFKTALLGDVFLGAFYQAAGADHRSQIAVRSPILVKVGDTIPLLTDEERAARDAHWALEAARAQALEDSL
jgi:hypothetical protein